MKKSEAKEFFISLVPSSFTFANILIPDDLQAMQLVIDSFLNIFLSEKPAIASLLQQGHVKNFDKSEIKIYFRPFLWKKIYELGKKRSLEVSVNFDFHNNRKNLKKQKFFKLPLNERVALYLIHQENISIQEASLIMDLPKHEIYSSIHRGQREIQASQ